MLGTAQEEIAKSNELWNSDNCKALREQQEKDFSYWGPYKFQMPQEEGKWDSVTTNSPKILANKIIGLLSSSWLQLYIDVDDEERKKRQSLCKTEQLANGCIWLADREAIAVPSGKKLQSTLASHAVIRGGTAKSLLWYTDKDKKPHCDIRTYDPFGCQWEDDGSEIIKFCYRNYLTKRYIEHTYKKQIKDGFNYGTADSYGRVLSYLFWDDEEWKVAINGEYVDSEKHGLGYVPVSIRSCGAVPHLQSETYQDTMKYSWQSYAVNTRDIYDLESKLLSIEASKAIDSGRKDIIVEYDSSKSGASKPAVEKVGYGAGQRNNVIFLDIAKGHKFNGFVEAPGNQVIDAFLTRVKSEMDILATIDPVAYGQMTGGGSGVLAAELRSAALEFINPFRECVENDFIWIAEESVRQFKAGLYDKISVEGRDRKREKFYIDLSPKDVEEKHFECNLVPDKLRDEVQELGAAIQAVTYDLSSRKTAMVKHNIVQDPDREMDNIANEKAAMMSMSDPVYYNNQMAKFYKDQGDEQMALYHQELAREAIDAKVQELLRRKQALTMPVTEENKPSTISPQAETGAIAKEPLRQLGVTGMGG